MYLVTVTLYLCSSPSPPRHRHSPSPRHRSPSSHSGSSAQRHSSSPRRRRSSSPTYHRSIAGSAGSPLSSRRSRSPFTSHDASSPHRRSDRSSPSHRHSRGRERFRGERERSVPAQERRHDRRDGNCCPFTANLSGFLGACIVNSEFILNAETHFLV